MVFGNNVALLKLCTCCETDVKHCDSFSSDTEWKSELVNSRNFDKEIGHQNPRYCSTFETILLWNPKYFSLVFLCTSSFNVTFIPVPWQWRVWRLWLLKSELGLSFCLKVSAVSEQSNIKTLQNTHIHIYTHTEIVSQTVEIHHSSSSGLVEQINNFKTLSLKNFNAFNLDPFLSIDDDYFYHTQYPRRPEVSIKMFTSPTYSVSSVFLIGALTELLLFVWFYS